MTRAMRATITLTSVCWIGLAVSCGSNDKSDADPKQGSESGSGGTAATGGTGGSSGVDYLRSTLDKRCFPELWGLRSHL